MKPFQQAKVIRPYQVEKFGYTIVVPVGATVNNQTACGPDNNYRFWDDWQSTAKALTGYENSTLAHDLTYYGINVPAEFCEPYQETQ